MPWGEFYKKMKINGAFVQKTLTKFIREELNKFGFKRGILGLSGGLDSTIIAYLTTLALGAGNVTALILPYGTAFDRDVEDAKEIASILGIKIIFIDITPMVDAYYQKHPTDSRILKGNKMARERMSILYDYSEREKALIIGTSNKTELLLGYGTLHGDMASAINPVGDLYKTQMRELAVHLKIPDKIVKKTPTAGLWPGQTDEDELGMSYGDIDKILFNLVDLRKSKVQLVSEGFDKKNVEKIILMIRNSEFKRKLPPIAKLSDRTVGHDFLYPYDWGR
jgi:NAD+ synthase